MKKALISGRGVKKLFESGGASNAVLDDLSVDIYEKDYTIIMGASGAGKSTLLYALSGMDKISGGQVFYKDQEISRYSEKQMAELRSSEFGFVFQQANLVSNLTLYENVVVAGYLNKSLSAKSAQQNAEKLLEQVRVCKAQNRLPSQVSGGEAQRAAIARAMVHQPNILFADEPTGSLNKRNTDEVLSLLTELNQLGQSILMVTHDVRAAIRGTRILYLEDGNVIDEMKLPAFEQNAAKERELKLGAWLASLEW